MPQIVASFPGMVSYKNRMIRAVAGRGVVRPSQMPKRAPNKHTEQAMTHHGYFCKQCGARAEKPEELRAHYLRNHPWALTDAGGEWFPGDPNAPEGARAPCARCGRMVSCSGRGHKCHTVNSRG